MAVCNDVTVAAENFSVRGVNVALEKCAKSLRKKTSFLVFVGSVGYPHVKKAVLQKRPVATRAKSDDFGAIWGRPGGSLGTLFRHLGAPRRDFARPIARKRASGRGSGRHVRKMTQTRLQRGAAGALKVLFSYESVGKNQNVIHRQTYMFLGGLGIPK